MRLFAIVLGAATALLLSACQGGTLPHQSASSAGDTKASWIGPNLQPDLLVYIADGSGVNIYDYKTNALVGQLVVPGAYAVCSDTAGNVWVGGVYRMLKFAPGETTSMAQVPSFLATGCAVDPKTGDLAVVTRGNQQGKENLEIYKGAQGTPKTYAYAAISDWEFCGYDNKSNLVVSGFSGQADHTIFAELAKGHQKLVPVDIATDYADSAGVQWDGHYFVMGYYNLPEVFRYSIKNGAAQLQGTTQLAVTEGYGVLNFVLHGKTLIASLQEIRSDELQRAGYAYPAGSPQEHDYGLTVYPYNIAVTAAEAKK
jgi:hypothetical protein